MPPKLQVGTFGQLGTAECRRQSEPLRHIASEEPVGRLQGIPRASQSLERPLPQRFSNRITHQQRPDERGAGDGRAEDDAEVRARMKTQAATDECPRRHDQGRSLISMTNVRSGRSKGPSFPSPGQRPGDGWPNRMLPERPR